MKHQPVFSIFIYLMSYTQVFGIALEPEEDDHITNPNIFQHVEFPINKPYRDVMKKILSNSQSTPQNSKKTNENKEKAIAIKRKFFKLNVTESRKTDTYRLLNKDAERDYITRDYHFINHSASKLAIDSLIEYIENLNKIVKDFQLYTGPFPLEHFDSFEKDQKRFFCKHFINNAVLLRDEGIFYSDERADEIQMVSVEVFYKKVEDEVKLPSEDKQIVQCPYKIGDRDIYVIGILPVYYESRTTIEYAFTYESFVDDLNGNMSKVTVKNLTKINKELDEAYTAELRKANKVHRRLSFDVSSEEEEEKEVKGKVDWFLPMEMKLKPIDYKM